MPALQAEVVDHTYGYDDAGNITRISDAPGGQTADHQCFRNDFLRRMVEAWTPLNGDCSSAPSYAGLGGPAPYWHQWTFDLTGNRLTEKHKASSGDITHTYTHPPAGTARPHTVTNVTASGAASWSRTYGYDNAGNTRLRGAQTLAWDREGHLESSSEGAQFRYDAGGSRLIRTDPDGSKTLYLSDGTEVRYDRQANITKAVRYYSHNGSSVAVRASGGLSWIVGDHHGTATATIDASSMAVSKRRTLPYGEARGTTAGTCPAAMDKGFVGGTQDPIGLTHLGAREYDPAIGRFVSADPVIDVTDPQQMHGYAYAANNPVTQSDPSGLNPCIRLDDASGPCIKSTTSQPGCTGTPDRCADNAGLNGDKRHDPRMTRTNGTIGPTLVASPTGGRVYSEVEFGMMMSYYDKCYVGYVSVTCGSPARYVSSVVEWATATGIDPRLLLTILINESGQYHGRFEELYSDTIGIGNMSREVFDQTKKGRDFEGANWRELTTSPELAIKATAWHLHDLLQALPWEFVYEGKGRNRDVLLAVGYNTGRENMVEIANGQSVFNPRTGFGDKSWRYVDLLLTNWDNADAIVCRSGAFSCSR